MDIKYSKMKNFILGVIIAVVFLMFCVYGVELLYDSPDIDDYCGRNLYEVETKDACEGAGGEWNDRSGFEDKSDVVVLGHCSAPESCYDEYDAVREGYSMNLFLIALIVSLAVIVVAALLVGVESVSGGLMFGSLMFLIYGTGSYWQFMDDWLRFVILGVALGILIFIGYKLTVKEETNN